MGMLSSLARALMPELISAISSWRLSFARLLVHAPRGGGTRLQVRVPWREAARSAFLAGDDDASAMPVQQAAGA